jgi:DNA repair exonuclease SbcCD nuclease subunit
MVRVIHTGDTHLGYRQYHSADRARDFQAAFDQVIDAAIDSDVDAVIHAGDLFHDRRPDIDALVGAIGTLERLADAEIPFLAIVGNHEARHDTQWLDLLARLGLAERLGPSPRQIGEVAFYGLDHRSRDLASAISTCEPTDAPHRALVAHGLFSPFAHAQVDTAELLDVAPVDLDVLLLGDNHVPGIETVDGVWVTYCGSTERVSASEVAPRGYNLVTLGADVEIRRRTIETRRFTFIEAQLAAGEGIERVTEVVESHPVTDAVVVVELTGDGAPVAPAAVEEVAAAGGALLTRVVDRRTRPDRPTSTEPVSFADPDAAVDAALTSRELSAQTAAIDGVIRDGSVPDTGVRERVASLLAADEEEGA